MKVMTRTNDGWYGLLVGIERPGYFNSGIIIQHAFYLKRRNHILKKAKKYRGRLVRQTNHGGIY